MPTREAVTEDVACCTFCLKSHTEVRTLVAGPAVFVCDGCVDLCSQLVHDRLEGRIDGAPRLHPWEVTDSLDVALANLPNVARAQAQVEASLVGWVRRARALGATWAQIGDALGITRQSAWERFAPEE
jgi:ATP-dependent protease Clp ATPase subunit